MFLAAVLADQFRPPVEHFFRLGIEFPFLPLEQFIKAGHRLAADRKQILAYPQRLAFAHLFHLGFDMGMVAAQAVGDLSQITGAFRRHDGPVAGRLRRGNLRQAARFELQAEFLQGRQHGLEERRHPLVVEPGGDSGEDRHLVGRGGKGLVVALILFAHVAQGIFGSAAVEFVDGHEVGEIEHVDLFQLRGRAKFRGHHIKRADRHRAQWRHCPGRCPRSRR